MLNLVIPAAGLPGLCAVVPLGSVAEDVALIVNTPVTPIVLDAVTAPVTLNAPVLVSPGVVIPSVPSMTIAMLFPYTVGGTTKSAAEGTAFAQTHSSVGAVAQTKLPATGVTAILRTSLRYAMNAF